MRTHLRAFFLTLTLALVAVLLAATSTHAQTEKLLADKLIRLQTIAAKNKGLVRLDSNTFDEALAKPRNYSMVILFTALSSEFQCVPCKLVVSGWSKLPDKSKLMFGSIDFKTGKSIFEKFGMTSAPSVLYFPAVDTQDAALDFDRYDLSKLGFKAEPFATWLSAKSGVPLRVKRPFDFTALLLNVLALVGFGAVSHTLYNRAGKIIRSKYLWAAVSLFTIFVMISGHMWNQIRNPPYSMPSRDGRPGVIAAGFQNQFGVETQIVAVLYAVMSGAVISLISGIPRIEDPAKQRSATCIWSLILMVMFSMLLYIFRLKNPGYPFGLMF